ncbi:urease accessory protein UreF [Rhizobium daejeonense]|uniref:Urease accessory protein UreF n=1 Tax=Rhizobium daejeonense TaxID=240521 RepID=A0A6M1RMB2_9HYPH|nr:urease accessory UreF family protein [Rhizobium daejeonense]NGO62412.1 urease accessory protein UreF [Rhizobium daejeonense]
MTDIAAHAEGRGALLRLLAWLSPAFPVGGFVYSGGLEAVIHDGGIGSAEELSAWLSVVLSDGSLRNDAILLAEAYRSIDDAKRLRDVVELAAALAGSMERHAEILRQGDAFLAAASAWPHPVLDVFSGGTAYSVAVGAVAAAHHVPLDDALAAFLQAQCAQLISVSVRLGVIGQKQGVAILAGLERPVLAQAERTGRLGLDELGSATVLADIASLRHEVQYSRLFQS